MSTFAVPDAGKAVQKSRRGRSMSVQAVSGRKRGGRAPPHRRDRGAGRPRGLLVLISLGIGPVRLSPLSVIEALFGGGSDVSQVIVREIRLPRTHPGAGDRRDPGTVRRVAAGPVAQPAGLAVAVRRAAIGRLRRGAGDRAGACRCALLCAAGGGDHGGVWFGVRAADDRRPQCRAVDPDPGGAGDFELLRAPPPRW